MLFQKIPDGANWQIAAIVTSVMIYMVKRHDEREREYDYVKKTVRLLYNEYIKNVDLAIILDQQKPNKEIRELPFALYSTKYMDKAIENDMIKDKKLGREIIGEIKRLTWFNDMWRILSKEVLLGNTNLENRIKDYLEYNDKQIHQKLQKTKDSINKYFQDEFCEVLIE